MSQRRPTIEEFSNILCCLKILHRIVSIGEKKFIQIFQTGFKNGGSFLELFKNWLCLASRRHIHIGLYNPNLVKGLAANWIAPICRILNFSLCNCSKSLGSRSSIVSVSDKQHKIFENSSIVRRRCYTRSFLYSGTEIRRGGYWFPA